MLWELPTPSSDTSDGLHELRPFRITISYLPIDGAYTIATLDLLCGGTGVENNPWTFAEPGGWAVQQLTSTECPSDDPEDWEIVAWPSSCEVDTSENPIADIVCVCCATDFGEENYYYTVEAPGYSIYDIVYPLFAAMPQSLRIEEWDEFVFRGTNADIPAYACAAYDGRLSQVEHRDDPEFLQDHGSNPSIPAGKHLPIGDASVPYGGDWVYNGPGGSYCNYDDAMTAGGVSGGCNVAESWQVADFADPLHLDRIYVRISNVLNFDSNGWYLKVGGGVSFSGKAVYRKPCSGDFTDCTGVYWLDSTSDVDWAAGEYVPRFVTITDADLSSGS